MRTIRTKVYMFNELSEDVKKVAIKKNRDINTLDENWHDWQLEDFTAELEKVGFLDAEIFYSGFWSQGDGLSFNAKIDPLKFAETPNEKRIAKLIESGLIDNFEIQKTSFANHYSHEKTRYIECYYTDHDNINRFLGEFCTKIESLRVELCKDFYSRIYKNYEENQSDQAVIDTIIANEIEFLSTGIIF